MKSHAIASCCLVILIITISSSCKKIIDEIIKNPNGGVASDCRISKVITNFNHVGAYGEGSFYDTAYFSYNKAGNPTQVRHSSNGLVINGLLVHDGDQYDLIFKYDNQNRLIAALYGYYRDVESGLDNATIWKTFEYTSPTTISEKEHWWASASYSPGDAYNTIKNTPENFEGPAELYSYQLDAYGRIMNGQYDNSGNLIGDNYVYGDKIHYYQTNKVWMFLARNYSVNIKTAPLDFYNADEFPTAFNSKKLPTKFSYYPVLVLANLRVISDLSGPSTMEYICK